MVDHEQQDENPAAPAPAPIPALTPQGAARRRLAGLGVSGVVMTVASTHAMAGLVCKSPSGKMSGDLKQSLAPSVACNGVSPGYWKKHAWPSEVLTTEMFTKYFPCSGPLSALTCLQVLSKQKADKYNVAMHIMATYLNVVSGRISFLSRQSVIDMWVEYNTTGVYIPVDGALPWSGGKLVEYLESTQG